MVKSKWARREVLKTGLAASAGAATTRAGHALAGIADCFPTADRIAEKLSPSGSQEPKLEASSRERLLVDFGWRFHLGHASDPAKDFGLAAPSWDSTFAKSGGMPEVTQVKFDDSSWQGIDLPHDWAVELPFQNDPELPMHGGKPLGRSYPETSIGRYRKVFELPEADAGRRIIVEFDGAFRNVMVILNGCYIGENFSGYAPFHF